MSARWQRESKRGATAAPGAVTETPRLEFPRGQGATLAALLRRARRLELPHALVVEGAPGVGKTTVMKWLTAALLCPSEFDVEGPCGVCRTCARVAGDQHPDVHVLDLARDEADKEEHKKSFYVIKVDQVRAAQEVLQRHAVEGRARVVRIDDADCMEEAGQNALLKTLEEPGPATFLLLESASPEQLLPTVRSRVQRLRVLPLDEATLVAEIARRRPDSSLPRERVVPLARGSLGLLLELLTEQAVHLHDVVLEVLGANKGLRPIALAAAALEGCKARQEEQAAARRFLWMLRAELRRRRDSLAAAPAGSYPGTPSEPWTTWLELTLAAERDLDLQIPPEQVLAACLLQF